MPRDIPVGNGQMLVTFDHHYQIRDLYFPHVGQENHAGGQPCRFGVWGTIPQQRLDQDPKEQRRKRMYWSDKGWDISRKYQDDTLATRVEMVNDELMIKLICRDVVDYHRPIMVRRIEVVNLADEDREIRLLHHHDFQMYGFKVGDTAYYDPQLRSVIHYRKERYITTAFYLDGEQQTDQYATGNAGFGGAEGTWRDAEDGVLGMNPIAQGAVDSTILCSVQLPANDTRVAYLVIGCGKNYSDCEEVHRFLHREGPQDVIDRTTSYWKLWLAATRTEFDSDDTGLSEKVYALYKRSLLTVRTQIDNGGAIIAANDSDYLQFSRDTYSYLWPRDGAFVADALAAGGFPDVSRSFYKFCSRVIAKRGMFLHKYTPDGAPASSWHPWVDAKGRPQMPIQEDETALVIWALWRHYVRYRDIEFVRPMWVKLVQPAAEFMVRYRDPDTKLPLPSYDLWEERWGVHAFTVASVYAGLKSAWQFAVCFGDSTRARRYAKAASEVRDAFCKHMWSEKHGRFLRRIEPRDTDRIAEFMADIFDNRDPRQTLPEAINRLPGVTESANGWSVPSEIKHKPDEVLDASMFAIFALGLLPANDQRVVKTMEAIEDRLTIKTKVGGVARYEDDYYHQVSQDTDNIPGNPWFICTLWMADYKIAKATTIEEVKQAATYLEWVADRALPSGCLAEQVHPETNAPLSVSPLTWSHATVVATLVAYLNKIDAIKEAERTGHSLGAVMPEAATMREGQNRHAISDAVPELK